MSSEIPDELDTLYARLERIQPPSELKRRVMESVVARSRARPWISMLVIAAGVALTAAISFVFGQQLRISGALDLLELALSDAELAGSAPAEVALAVWELTPWPLAALVAACAGIVGSAARLVLAPPHRSGRAWAGG